MQPTPAAEFVEKVLKSPKPVLLDLYADWCGPCKAMVPALEQLAQQAGDTLSVIKMNIDEVWNAQQIDDSNKDLAAFVEKNGIRSIPAIALFNNGELLGFYKGNRTTGAMRLWAASTVAKANAAPSGPKTPSL